MDHRGGQSQWRQTVPSGSPPALRRASAQSSTVKPVASLRRKAAAGAAAGVRGWTCTPTQVNAAVHGTRDPGRGSLTPTPDGPASAETAQSADGDARCLPLAFSDVVPGPIPADRAVAPRTADWQIHPTQPSRGDPAALADTHLRTRRPLLR
jgi:hypothetical protein